MQFILSHGWEEGIADLTQRLAQDLAAGKRVLWLVTGGSSIPACTKIMDSIADDLSRNLSIMLTDERYGAVGHTDSNWGQLIDAGFVAKHAKTLEVLRDGDSFEQAAKHYESLSKQALADNQVVIAQLGIGQDGHLAGILPGSPAANETEALVVAYEAPPYRRLTLTFAALRRVTADYSFAFGESKRPALTSLKKKQIKLQEQPAQILKELPEAYIYSDIIGETKS